MGSGSELILVKAGNAGDDAVGINSNSSNGSTSHSSSSSSSSGSSGSDSAASRAGGGLDGPQRQAWEAHQLKEERRLQTKRKRLALGDKADVEEEWSGVRAGPSSV